MFAKEGYPFIIASALLFIVILFIPKTIMVTICLLVLLMMLWFFRDPERISPHEADAVVSAADGKVVEISEAIIDGKKYKKVSVFMNLFSVHVNRAPYAGTVSAVRHIAGTFLPADKPEASAQNERNEIHINTPKGKIIAVQVAGLVARRTVSYVEEGSSVTKGDRIGMIKFSSRVDHYLPMTAHVVVLLDDKVKAGESIIARM
ncbi:MAG: phosphatidylserine decarboxylase family protein [Deferribacteraceae bacterium]|jgi:phosphatidylserine decarboxylase|nr:phosphatidylserine decarboxylase family protein [Deferribacteraceae bacterium]